jgi:hypothetical protein
LVQQNSGRWARYQIAAELKKIYQEKPIKKTYQEKPIKKSYRIIDEILMYCIVPRSAAEIAQYIGNNKVYLRAKYLKSLVAKEKLKLTNPASPTTRNQKYVTAKKTL